MSIVLVAGMLGTPGIGPVPAANRFAPAGEKLSATVAPVASRARPETEVMSPLVRAPTFNVVGPVGQAPSMVAKTCDDAVLTDTVGAGGGGGGGGEVVVVGAGVVGGASVVVVVVGAGVVGVGVVAVVVVGAVAAGGGGGGAAGVVVGVVGAPGRLQGSGRTRVAVVLVVSARVPEVAVISRRSGVRSSMPRRAVMGPMVPVQVPLVLRVSVVVSSVVPEAVRRAPTRSTSTLGVAVTVPVVGPLGQVPFAVAQSTSGDGDVDTAIDGVPVEPPSVSVSLVSVSLVSVSVVSVSVVSVQGSGRTRVAVVLVVSARVPEVAVISRRSGVRSSMPRRAVMGPMVPVQVPLVLRVSVVVSSVVPEAVRRAPTRSTSTLGVAVTVPVVGPLGQVPFAVAQSTSGDGDVDTVIRAADPSGLVG